jgi:septal ring factor EnvC (AmiA/AmiB activator)
MTSRRVVPLSRQGGELVRRRSLVATLAVAAMSLGVLAPQLAEIGPPRRPPGRARARTGRAGRRRLQDRHVEGLAVGDRRRPPDLDDNLRTQEAALARTEAEVAQAEQDIADAEAAIERLEEEIVTLRDEIRRRAVQAFVTPPG